MNLTLDQLKKFKTSDRIYILGSGKSILDITKEEWKVIKKHDTIGFNHWYVHDFEPTFYDLSYLANDYFDDPKVDMFCLASKKCKNSKFILNHALNKKYEKYFENLDIFKTHINHFDFFDNDLIELEKSNCNNIGKIGKYWSLDIFKFFNQPYGSLLPNDNFIYKSRGQLFATLQLAILLEYKDIRFLGVDLTSEEKFQDHYDDAPYTSRSVGRGGEKFEPRLNTFNHTKDQVGIHNTAQGTRDKNYLGIHKLIDIFNRKCLSSLGINLSVCNPNSLLTTVGIKYTKITEELQIDKITFCIPSKSNLRYLKTCIPSIRKNAYRKDHDIIVFVDEDTDNTIEWLEEVKEEYNIKYYVNPELGKKLYGIGKAYDYCIEKSTTDVFMIFHADMMLGKNADLKALNYLQPKTVVCATRVEPPLHPNNGEKILKHFGMYPEDFKEKEFEEYVISNLKDTKTTEGIFAPWMMYKEEFLAIGGHDPIMHSCREDSDVFNRMLLDGFNFIQPWNSLVYHLTGRGAGSFDGDKERHERWKRDMNNSTKEFIRKWGSNVNHTPLMKPIVNPKYDIGIEIKNTNDQLVEALEMWCSNLKVDKDVSSFIAKEQPNTQTDLESKITKEDLKNDIQVSLDARTFTQDDYVYIQQLPLIIQDSGEEGEFELGNIKIFIKFINELQNNLIKI